MRESNARRIRRIYSDFWIERIVKRWKTWQSCHLINSCINPCLGAFIVNANICPFSTAYTYPTLLSASTEAQTEHDEVATRAGGVGVFSSRRLISSEGENTHTRCEVALTCLKGSPCFDIQHNYLTRRSFWQEIWKLKISKLKFLSQMWCVCELMLSLQRLRWCIWAQK